MEYGLVFVWLAAYVALGAAAVPLAALVFPEFADRGAGLALPLSLATVGVVAYWVGRAAFGWPALVAGLAVVLGGSWLALRRGADPDWEAYLDAVGVFALGFALLVGVRLLDPAAWPGGGEKFLDFGLLASLLRAGTLPPQDPWFAGEPVRYYYGGHMLASLLARLTGTAPRYAYNLALAGFYALLVSAAFGLAGAVAADNGYPRRLAGGFAAFLVGVASNLHTPLALAFWLLPGRVKSAVVANTPVAEKGLAAGPVQFDYWLASRVIEGTINEFPFFAWFNADMHAHMMSTPFLLLAAGLLFAYWQAPAGAVRRRRLLLFGCVGPLGGLLAVVNTWSFPTVAGLAVLAVALAPASPASLLPARLAHPLDRLVAGGREPGVDAARLPGEVGRAVLAIVVAAAVAGVGTLVAAPFLLDATAGRTVALLPDRSGLGELLVVHGVFLAISAGYLGRALGLSRRGWAAAGGGVAALVLLTWPATATALALFVPPVAAGWYLLRTDRRPGYETVLLVGATGLVVLVEFVYVKEAPWATRLNTVFKFYMQVWVLWATAVGAMLPAVLAGWPAASPGTDRSGDARPAAPAPRADGAGSADPPTDDRGTGRPATDEPAADGPTADGPTADGTAAHGPGSADPPGTDGSGSGESAADGSRADGSGPAGPPARGRGADGDRGSALGPVLAALLLFSLSLYAGLAVADRASADRGDDTLDALHYVHERHPGEAAAIEWLADRDGQPHMASAPGVKIYRWVNGPSSLTGIPTVAGWAHERGYRGPGPYSDRVRDVRILFTGDARSRAAIVRKYDVRYVYVGPIEKERYGDLDFRDEPGFSVAFRAGNVTIYEVDRSALVGS